MSIQEDANTLSPAAKRAVRAYILTLFIPSAIAISVVSGLVGFVINDYARDKAYAAAYSEATTAILRTASEASSASAIANLMSKEIEAARNGAKDSERYMSEMKAQADKLVTGNYESLAEGLIKYPAFKESIVRVSDDRYVALDKSLTDVNGRIDVLIGKLREVGTPVTQPFGKPDCPPGMFMIGLKLLSVPGGRSGYLGDAAVVCRLLNLP
jgi:hypothetical protein